MEYSFYQKLLEIEKEMVREVARGDKNYHERICRSQSTNQFGERNKRLTDLCFAICRFSPERTEGKQITDEDDTSEACNNRHVSGRAVTNAKKRN